MIFSPQIHTYCYGFYSHVFHYVQIQRNLRIMVLKIGPNWPIRPVELSTGELSIWSISMNRFVIKLVLNHSSWFRFFANHPHLNLTNICLLFKRPIIHQAHSTPNAFKIKTNYKLIFGPSHQAQSNDKKAYNTFIWAMPPGPICWHV